MSKNKPKKLVIVISILFNFMLIKIFFLGVTVVGVSGITAEQRKEIESLKSELTEAFEKNDNEDLDSKGVIVQPTWTQGSVNSEPKQTANVEVTSQNRQETAALRAEIVHAVAHDNYAANGRGASSQNIKKLEASLGMKEKGKDVLQHMLGVSAPAQEAEQVGSASDDRNESETSPKVPNVIMANIGEDSDIDIRKLQSLEVAKRRTKEVLVLKYIEEDFTFDLGDEVHEWEHIVHGGQEYFIGRRLTDLLIVRKDAAKYEPANVVDIGHPISYLESYTYWNLEQQQQEGVILIATKDKVLWYRVNLETKQFELYWDWMVGNTITGLTYFTLDSKDYLTVSSNQSSLVGHYALNIYQYKLDTKEFWIAQRLQLEHPCDEVTVLNTGRDVILAVPQNNSAAIYTFNPHEAAYSHLRFQLKRAVASEGILTIAGFKMGGRSYLALTGYQPQILLYQQGDFMPKTILGNNFGLVELFFPIPVRTYRDDLILLVQHRVDFATHTLTVVETLIWDGEAFETSIPIPCHLGKHVVYGVACMLDLQRDEGLKGAALLRKGEEISVIVPRFKAESGLFRFHTELLAKNSELLDLQETFMFLKDWVKEQDDLIIQAQAFLNMPDEQLANSEPNLSHLDILNTPEFVFSGEVGEIYVNDYKWSNEDSNIDLEYIIQNIEDLDKNLASGRQRRELDDMVYDTLNFDDVEVENLELENLNGSPFYIQNGNIDFKGVLSSSELEVLDKIVDVQKRQANEDFILEGDLEFDVINDVAWSDIKDNLVWRTQPQNLDLLNVEEVIVEDVLSIKTLNTLEFPDEFLLANGPAASIVKAEKHFTNTLTASAVDTDGFINGKSPLDAITLMDPQDWRGLPTFNHLEISEKLQLNGTAHGRNVDKFPQNPTLQETNIIEASCQFNELYVNGPLIIKGQIDDKPLGALLKDIIQRSDDPAEEVLVPSSKSFGLVMFPTDFVLDNNTINHIPANDFVTIHTNQTLHVSSLEGYVYFYNLTLLGTYDGVKIEDILKEAIMLDKPVDLSATELIFSDHINAATVTILQTINNQTIKDNLQTLQEDLVVKSIEFENLQAQQTDFLNDILGTGKLNNVELHTFVNEGSWHEPPIKGNIFLNELILDQGLQTDELHGIKAEFLLDFIKQIDELPDMVLNGQIQVDHITVTGDVQVHKLNGEMFDEDIQFSAIWLNRPNYLATNIQFKNRLNIRGNVNVVANFRGDYMPNIIEDMVLRSPNATVNIMAPKSFLRPVKVLQNSQLKALNGVPMENIAWKTRENNFKGSLDIKGNLIVENIAVAGHLNNFTLQELQNLLYYDPKLKNFVLKNTIQFDDALFLEDLTVLGDYNDIPSLSDFFENLIYKNNLCLLKGKNTFTGRVSIERGAYIKYLNGHNLMDLFNNMVFIHDSQPVVIRAPVRFEDSIKAQEISIKKTLNATNLNGCDIEEWLKGSLRVDQDQNIPHYLHFAAGSLDGNSMNVHFLNDIDMSRIITLNTPQTFNETVKFSEIYLNGVITTNGSVNGVKLEEEFNNTLMTYGNQHISTPLTIQSIIVLGDVTVKGVVNQNKDLQDVATLQENLTLESPLYFKSIYSPTIIMKDLVAGIDFDKWFQTAVKSNGPPTQVITGNWSVKTLTVKSGPNDFQYMINGFEPWQYNSFIRSTRSNDKDDQEICQLLKGIWSEIHLKSVYIKYIEEDFHINLETIKEFKENNEIIRKIFYLKSLNEDLILVNQNCLSFMFKWLAHENKFVFTSSYESGPLQQVEVLPTLINSTGLQFITTNDSTDLVNCTLKNLNIWKLANNTITLRRALTEEVEELYKQKSNNFTILFSNKTNVNELDVETLKTNQKWKLPLTQNETRYRFVPLEDSNEIFLTNGQNMLVISDKLKKKFKKSVFPTTEPPHVQQLNESNTESILKPNSSLARSFVFSDFKQVVERILVDLGQRLNQQVNITQLSIPESDLFDEHLVPDFLAIMEELQKQHIYTKEILNIDFNNITVPENPAQVLAARLVQIAWPVVIEIEEIHSYLRTNKTHDHPLCACITKSLGFLIRDVLLLANEHNTTQDTKDYSQELTNVIKRIRTFEKDLQEFVEVLQQHKDQTIDVAKLNTTKTVAEEKLEQSPANHDYRILDHSQDKLLFVENSHLPGYKRGEILSLKVGEVKNSLHLLAVTNTQMPLTPSLNAGIHLYFESLKGQLYQVINAKHARSLQHLRVKQETLLIYIEECCQVQILRYEGSRGFVKLAGIQSKAKVTQILTVTLPGSGGNFKYYLILVTEKKLKFYEIVIEGNYSEPPPLPLSCL